MNGRTHRKIGAAAGAVTAFSRSSSTDDFGTRIIEAIGGALAGMLGARLPDWIEPAIHSHHRSTFHSVAAGTALYKKATSTAGSWEAMCRANVAHFEARLREPTIAGNDRLACALLAFLWRLAVGFVAGGAAGYISHLILDATTPRSLPLITRGY